jgi:thiosulfate dehydrogenase [quinone] large subunit
MSRRDRYRAQREASIRDHGFRPRAGRLSRAAGEPEAPDPHALLERLTLALIPLRVFLGVTFVYAGVDKLIDPAFLQASGPGSIGEQLAAFVKVSPIAPLVEIFGQTFPVEVGLLIAIAEIAIGLGALSGLLFRAAAVGGFALSILFWLTASWATTPYYYGPDLPYAMGWLTLALAGTGGRFTLETWIRRLADGGDPEPVSPDRRLVLQAGIVGAVAVAVAALAGTVGASTFGRTRNRVATGAGDADAGSTSAASTGSAETTGTGSPAAVANGARVATDGGSTGAVIGTTGQLASGRSVAFEDPTTGDPGVLLRLADGTYVAFDAVCTHAGCTVEFDRPSGFLLCPCHGAAFDPHNRAAVIAGPARRPLSAIPIHVDAATGKISLTG